MADPRKGTRHLAGAEMHRVLETAHDHLLACTSNGSQALGCTGASFVTMGIGLWAAELAELDPRATAILLRALADMVDPANTPAGRSEAAARRRYAVQLLHQAVDLAMSQSEGRA